MRGRRDFMNCHITDLDTRPACPKVEQCRYHNRKRDEDAEYPIDELEFPFFMTVEIFYRHPNTLSAHSNITPLIPSGNGASHSSTNPCLPLIVSSHSPSAMSPAMNRKSVAWQIKKGACFYLFSRRKIANSTNIPIVARSAASRSIMPCS